MPHRARCPVDAGLVPKQEMVLVDLIFLPKPGLTAACSLGDTEADSSPVCQQPAPKHAQRRSLLLAFLLPASVLCFQIHEGDTCRDHSAQAQAGAQAVGERATTARLSSAATRALEKDGRGSAQLLGTTASVSDADSELRDRVWDALLVQTQDWRVGSGR